MTLEMSSTGNGGHIWRQARRLVVCVVGGTLILFAILLIPLPIVPGWPLILVGLAVFAIEFAWARRLLKRARAKLNPSNWGKGRGGGEADSVEEDSCAGGEQRV